MPDLYRQFVSWLQILNFDLSFLFSFGCVLGCLDFYGKLLLVTLAPLAFYMVLGIVYVLVKRYTAAHARPGDVSPMHTSLRGQCRHPAAGDRVPHLLDHVDDDCAGASSLPHGGHRARMAVHALHSCHAHSTRLCHCSTEH